MVAPVAIPTLSGDVAKSKVKRLQQKREVNTAVCENEMHIQDGVLWPEQSSITSQNCMNLYSEGDVLVSLVIGHAQVRGYECCLKVRHMVQAELHTMFWYSIQLLLLPKGCCTIPHIDSTMTNAQANRQT